MVGGFLDYLFHNPYLFLVPRIERSCQDKLGNYYRDITPKWFAVSIVCFVGGFGFLYLTGTEGDPEFSSTLARLCFFSSVMCFGVGLVFHLFSRSSEEPRSSRKSGAGTVLALLSAIAAIITIVGALRGCSQS